MSSNTRYVPILRWKQGERTALNHLTAAGRANVAPLIAITRDLYKASKQTKHKVPITAHETLVAQIFDCWGTTAVFLDASDLAGAPAHHDLDDIAAAARARGLTLIPATTRHAGANYAAAVARMNAVDGRGAALRVSLNEMATLATWIGAWSLSPSDTDLIVDMEQAVGTVLGLGAVAGNTFASLHLGSSWRSVTAAGGCLPATLTGFAIGSTTVDREELNLWQILNAHGLPYRIDFGDYATISPAAPTVSIPALVPINAKYSLPDKFLVFHGVKIKGPGAQDMDVQLRAYAQAIVAHPGRNAISTCWGDIEINRHAASGVGGKAGSPGSWVGISVNRHIEITRLTLP